MREQVKKYEQKWGFGMAPLKRSTEYENRKATVTMLNFLEEKPLEAKHLDDMSHFKGMVNRCVKQDQWDWFTVYTLFKQPDPTLLKDFNHPITDIRHGFKVADQQKIELARQRLVSLGAVDLCLFYLGKKEPEYVNEDYGYLYILSRREERNTLKIGMTTRDVETRTKEINSSTGVLYPYSVRRIFRVNDAKLAEKEVFGLLDEYRIRKDREFFNIDFYIAQSLIKNHLIENQLLLVDSRI
ncbi:GIY-YIG nuclease family protein [Planococcus sp. SIMBA_143]